MSFVSVSCMQETDLERKVTPSFLVPHNKQHLPIAVTGYIWYCTVLYSNWDANVPDMDIHTCSVVYFLYLKLYV